MRYQMPRICFVFAYCNGALEIKDEDYYVGIPSIFGMGHCLPSNERII